MLSLRMSAVKIILYQLMPIIALGYRGNDEKYLIRKWGSGVNLRCSLFLVIRKLRVYLSLPGF
jgi:hypothetical protein